jgi:DNA-binding transcriptional LysR family regulator
MRIESLHEFVVFAKHQNFSAAARELNYSQPSLSAHLASLEKELGFSLIDRSRNFSLTPAGGIVLKAAQDILSTYSQAVEKAKTASREVPPLRISSLARGLLPYTDDIHFEIVDVDANNSPLHAIQKNIVDIDYTLDFTASAHFIADCEESQIGFFHFKSRDLVILIPTTHPLSQKEHLCREDFFGETFVITVGAYFTYQEEQLDAFFGPDSGISYNLGQSGRSLANLAFFDPGSNLQIIDRQTVYDRIRPGENYRIVSEVDGLSLQSCPIVLYREDSKNEYQPAFLDRLRKQQY